MKEFISNNFGIKIVSVCIAILLELYFYSPDNSVTAICSALVEFKNIPSSMMVVSPPGAEKGYIVSVKVRGPHPLVARVKAEVHKLIINFPSGDRDLQTFKAILNPQQLALPNGVEVIEVDPPVIVMKLEPIVTKELRVNTSLVGEPAQDFKIETVKAIPPYIIAQGPLSELENRTTIDSAVVDVAGLKETTRFDLSLTDVGTLTNLKVRSVSVYVKVIPISQEKTFDRVNITALAPRGFAATIEPSTAISVVLNGPPSIINTLEKRDVHLEADGRSLSAGQYEIAVTGNFPNKVELINTIPSKVTMKLVNKNG